MNRPVSLPPMPWDANAPEITVETTLKGRLATKLIEAAKRRKREPVDVLADIVNLVLRDDLIDAILDDGVGGK